MIAALALAGTTLALFLLIVAIARRRVGRQRTWLCTWLLAQLAFFSSLLLTVTTRSALSLWPAIAGQIALCAAPLSQYVYAATALKRPRHSRVHAAILATAIILLAAIVAASHPVLRNGAIVIEEGTPWLLLVPLFAAAVGISYGLAVLRMVHAWNAQLRDELSMVEGADPQWLRLWAWATICFFAAGAVLVAGSMMPAWPVDLHMAIVLVFTILNIAFVGQLGLTRAGIFHDLPLRPERSRVAALDMAAARHDYGEVDNLFAREKPHLDPGLTAQQLSDRLGWAPDRLTVALRHGGGKSFFDAVNAARVEEVKRLATDPRNARITILNLALDAGFGSKSAFYEAFQRHVGCTPKAWLAQVLPAEGCKSADSASGSSIFGSPDDISQRRV